MKLTKRQEALLEAIRDAEQTKDGVLITHPHRDSADENEVYDRGDDLVCEALRRLGLVDRTYNDAFCTGGFVKEYWLTEQGTKFLETR